MLRLKRTMAANGQLCIPSEFRPEGRHTVVVEKIPETNEVTVKFETED